MITNVDRQLVSAFWSAAAGTSNSESKFYATKIRIFEGSKVLSSWYNFLLTHH